MRNEGGSVFTWQLQINPLQFTEGPDMLLADTSEVTDIDKDIDAW